MSITFYAHPFSSYCQKVFIALFENDTQHSLRLLDFGDKEIAEEFAGVWPIRRMPVVVDDGRSVMEATIIIEYLDLHYPGRVRFLPPDPKEALEIRFMDRFFDNYVATPMQRIVFNAMRREDEKDTQTDTDAHVLLDMAYRWLDRRIESSEWACGAAFMPTGCIPSPTNFQMSAAIEAACSPGLPSPVPSTMRARTADFFRRVLRIAIRSINRAKICIDPPTGARITAFRAHFSSRGGAVVASAKSCVVTSPITTFKTAFLNGVQAVQKYSPRDHERNFSC